MILTPIPRDQLDAALDRFAAQLDDPAAHAAFVRIRATAPERASGEVAKRHQQQAIAVASHFGVPVHPPGTHPPFNWDGTALDGDTEAYVILHEIAHFVLAPPERCRLIDFGLGPGPDTRERVVAERAAVLPLPEREADEAEASLLGILWEAALYQPALASFLDQNWLEGLERSAARHFSDVFGRLRRRGLAQIAFPVEQASQRGRCNPTWPVGDVSPGIRRNAPAVTMFGRYGHPHANKRAARLVDDPQEFLG